MPFDGTAIIAGSGQAGSTATAPGGNSGTYSYCLQSDIESILAAHGVVAAFDDNQGGTLSATELAYITDAIDYGAALMNTYLVQRYKLSELVGSNWCRFCNAVLAAGRTMTRRGHPVPGSLQAEIDNWLELLKQVGSGFYRIPDKVSSYDHRPSVSNLAVDIGRRQPVRKDTVTSTGPLPQNVVVNPLQNQGWR